MENTSSSNNGAHDSIELLYENLAKKLENDYHLEKFFDPDPALIDKYYEQATASEGFYVDIVEVGSIFGRISPTSPANSYVQAAAAFAMEQYNKNEGKDLKINSIVRANSQVVNGYLFFLTLEASDGCFYEAKVYYSSRHPKELYFFRPAKYYPSIPG